MSKQINAEYVNTLTEIMKYPEFECSPRGMKIYEKINHTFNVDMDCPIITRKSRNLNYRFMFGEAAWILDGGQEQSDRKEEREERNREEGNGKEEGIREKEGIEEERNGEREGRGEGDRQGYVSY